MVYGGFCAIGFWQTYDIKCPRVWVWKNFPPHYVCAGF
jgi:hypothetical protein